MTRFSISTLATACLLALVSCDQETRQQAAGPSAPAADGVLLRVGSVTVTQQDLDYQLREKHAGRDDDASTQLALDELTERARLTQAALDAGMEADPIARAEIARILISRLRETGLDPQLRALAATEIPESRLREIYESRKDQFQSGEKRQVAVLWLNPGADPERASKYQEKLTQARDWYLSNQDLIENPSEGFSVLGVDHSEHAATRFKKGVLGWLERDGGADPVSKSAAEIAFSLEKAGAVSEVITRPEGIFLVRCMAVKPAFTRPFESVSAELAQAERQRMRQSAEADFESAIKSRYAASPMGDTALSQVPNTP